MVEEEEEVEEEDRPTEYKGRGVGKDIEETKVRPKGAR